MGLSWESVKGTCMGSDSLSDESPERRFRTLFISDVHLGARGSQADRLLDFLRSHDADTIYLVGDIVDGWALKSGWHWPQSHNDFVQKMLRKARKGAKRSEERRVGKERRRGRGGGGVDETRRG